MKKLGFGLMRMPILDKTNPADVDIEHVRTELGDPFCSIA